MTLPGISILFSPLPENALFPIAFIPSGNVICNKLFVFLNASFPIVVTPSGIVICSTLKAPAAIQSGISFIPSSKIISFKYLSLKRAPALYSPT